MDFFSDNTSLYMFSALLQANAAILSLLAIFVIFSIQSLRATIESAKYALALGQGKFVGPGDIANFERKSLSEKESWAKDTGHSGVYSDGYYRSWISCEKRIKAIKRVVTSPSILLGISIVVYAWGIFFSNFIHLSGQYVELISLVMAIVLEAICVWMVIKKVFDLLKDT